MYISQVKQVLQPLRDSNITPLLTGHAGIGKTHSVRQWVAEKNGLYVDYRLGQMSDAGDLIGLPDIVTKENGDKSTHFCIPSRIAEAVAFATENPDKPVIICFDELNRANKDLIQAIFQMVYDKELNGVSFPENLSFVCIQNPPTEEYDVLDFDDEAFSDRFVQIKVEFNSTEWFEYAKANKYNTMGLAFLNEMPEFLDAGGSDFDLGVKYRPRSWSRILQPNGLLENAGKHCLEKSVVHELIRGMVGDDAAVQFVSYMENNDKRIDANLVLNDYAAVKTQVEKYSNENTMREDIISVCNDDLIGLFEKYNQPIKDLIETNSKRMQNGEIDDETFKREFLDCINNTELLTDQQCDNVCQYLATIPVELCLAFLDQVKIMEVIACDRKNRIANNDLLWDRLMPIKDELLESLKKKEENND